MSQIHKASSNLEEQMNQAMEHLDHVKSDLKDQGNLSERGNKLLNALYRNFATAEVQIKAFKKGDQSVKLFKELQKIKKLLRSLDGDPEMQIKSGELLIFWQVIDSLFEYIDSFDRATVKPKRIRVEGVSNEKLDAR